MFLTPTITAYDSEFLSKHNTGLGNVLFQIASCYGLSKETGRIPVWNKLLNFSEKLYRLFGFNHRNTIFRNFKQVEDTPFYRINENNIHYYDENLVKFIREYNGPIELFGYLECLQYFNKYKDDIVKLFSPDEQSLSLISKEFPILFNTDYTTICLHFRGQEYLHNNHIGKKWDYNYYNRAIEYFKTHIKNPIFLIFSDDMESIEQSFLDNCGEYQKIVNTEDYIDLWCQTLCKHSIVSRSTFSFWGAYLNLNPDKIILYNKNDAKPYHIEFTPI